MSRTAQVSGAEQRRRFAEEFAKDFNATQAAIRAGYSKRSAKQQGSRLMTYADVRDHLAKIVGETTRKNEITVERTMQQIARLAYGDVRQLYRADGSLKAITELDDDSAPLVAGVEQEEINVGVGEERVVIGALKKIKVRDQLNALDKCMSILAMHKSLNPAAGAGGLNLHIYPSTYKRPK